MEPRTWHRKDAVTKQTYLISTRREYVDEDFINAAFATKDMFWAKPLPSAMLTIMLDNCITLGLYVTAPPANSASDNNSGSGPAIYSELRQIGLARLITDHVTFAYVTDVYVQPEHRGKGLATWLTKCCGEVMDKMRAQDGEGFRNALLVTSNVGQAVPMYETHLGFHVPDQDPQKGPVVMSTKFTKH